MVTSRGGAKVGGEQTVSLKPSVIPTVTVVGMDIAAIFRQCVPGGTDLQLASLSSME